MKKIFTTLCIITLSACATNQFLMTTPEGNNVYKAQCNLAGTAACFQEAQKACPFGFDIMSYNQQYINTGSRTKGNINSFGYYNAFSNTYNGYGTYNSYADNTNWNRESLIYVCRPMPNTITDTPDTKKNK